MKKGQVFLITSVVFIIVIIILKISFNQDTIEARKTEVEYNFKNKYFYNINREIFKSAEISLHQPSNITRNLFNFLNFTRNKMNEKGTKFEVFLFSSLSSESLLNVSVINLLNKTINVSLVLNSTPEQSKTKDDLVDYGFYETSFNINEGEIYKLTIKYEEQESNVTIITNDDQNIYTILADVVISGGEIEYKDKSQNSYKLP